MYKDKLRSRLDFNSNELIIYTEIFIHAGDPVIEVTGKVMVDHELPDPNHPALIQAGPNTFIGPSGNADDYIRHSCDPNCYLHVMGNRVVLFSLYDIQPGTEITFDYSTSSTDTLDTWQMQCHCKSYKCRKVISGIQYLPTTLIESYKAKGMIPAFITHPNLFVKK